MFGRIRKSIPLPFRRRRKSKDEIIHPASPVSVLDIPHPVETVMLQDYEQAPISPYGDTRTRSWDHGVLKVGDDISNQKEFLHELSYPRVSVDDRLQNVLDRHNAIIVSDESGDDHNSPSMDETSESSNHDSSANSWVAAYPEPTLAPTTPLPRIALKEIMSPDPPGSRLSRSNMQAPNTETSKSTAPIPESKDEHLPNNVEGVIDKESQAQRMANQQDAVSNQTETKQSMPSKQGNSSAKSNEEVRYSSDLKGPKEKEPMILKIDQKVRIVGASIVNKLKIKIDGDGVHKSYSKRDSSMESRVRETTVDSDSSDNSISSLEESVPSPTALSAEGATTIPSKDSLTDICAGHQGEWSAESRESSTERLSTLAVQDHGADLPRANQNDANVVEDSQIGNMSSRSGLDQASPVIGVDSVQELLRANSSSNEEIEGTPSVVESPSLLEFNENVGSNGNLSSPVDEIQPTNASRCVAAAPAIPVVPIDVQGVQRDLNGDPDNTRSVNDDSNGTSLIRENRVNDFTTNDRVRVIKGRYAPSTGVVVGVTACFVKVELSGSDEVHKLKPTSLLRNQQQDATEPAPSISESRPTDAGGPTSSSTQVQEQHVELNESSASSEHATQTDERANQVGDFTTNDRVRVVKGYYAPNTGVVVGVTACFVKVELSGSDEVHKLKPTSLLRNQQQDATEPAPSISEIRPTDAEGPTSSTTQVHEQHVEFNESSSAVEHATQTAERANQVGDFTTNNRVRVVKGYYAPNIGLVVGLTACFVKVRLIGSDEVHKLKPTSLLKNQQQEAIGPAPEISESRPTNAEGPTSSSTQVQEQLVEFNESSSAVEHATRTDEDVESKLINERSPVVVTEEPRSRATEGMTNEIIGNRESTRISHFQEGDRVRAIEGPKEGAVGTVTEILEILVRVEFDGQTRIWAMLPQKLTLHPEQQQNAPPGFPVVIRQRQANPRPAANSGRARSDQKKASTPSNFDSWKWTKSIARSFGNRIVVKERVAAFQNSKGGESTFLSLSLHSRMRLVEVPLNTAEEDVPFEKEVVDADGSKFQLVLAKVKNDSEVSSFGFTKAKCVQLIYARVSGPGTEPQDLQDMLERLGDFGRLAPRKAAARLELLHSPACKLNSHPSQMYGIFSRPVTDLCEIEDLGHEGCGFICENLLKELLGGRIDGHRAIAVQVRIVAPKIGIFKGVLGKKRITSGAPIQLPSSMKKVGPSSHKDANMHEAFILINRVTPSQNTRMVARLLDPNEKDPPDSWTPAKLSDMIFRLWKSLGVPEKVGSKYITQSRKAENLKHSFVVGLSDPTSMLPAGSIFIPGLHKANLPLQEIFVTRVPCVEPRDGRMLRLVTSKPRDMPINTWEWLHTLHFGSIIFANPKPGTVSLPAQIAAGDLDGDLYLICWAFEEVLQHIATAEPIDIDLLGEEDAKPDNPYMPEWLSKTQEVMIDAPAMRALQALIGKLYTSANKVADKSKKGMHDEDSIMYARAFKRALEIGKHGGQVYLPAHLHANIPTRFHKVLVSEDIL